MANLRIFYACQAVAFAECGTETFVNAHGVQSLGISTKFNLEQVFEMGQISIYDNRENIPDVEVTLEKVLDGYPLLYHLATYKAPAATIVGRSNIRSTLGLSIYSDVQEAASGTALSQCQISGLYPSQFGYNFQVNGPFTESLTLVGNNKIWNDSFTASSFTNTDVPAAAEGVNFRQDLIFGTLDDTLLPPDVYGISSSGTNDRTLGVYGAHVQSIKISVSLGREQMFELGRKGAYNRFINFPVEVRTDIEVFSTLGDKVAAVEEATNLTARTIYIKCREGTEIDLGTKNKLSNAQYGGANAGQNGGNATVTYSFITYNDCTVLHSADVTTGLRP